MARCFEPPPQPLPRPCIHACAHPRAIIRTGAACATSDAQLTSSAVRRPCSQARYAAGAEGLEEETFRSRIRYVRTRIRRNIVTFSTCGHGYRAGNTAVHGDFVAETGPSLRILSASPSLRAQISVDGQDHGRAEIAPHRRRCRCRSSWAAPRAKGLSGHDLLLEGVARLLFSTHGPNGPRRRLRRRVPGNTGRGAGDARCARALGRARARSTGGGGELGEALA